MESEKPMSGEESLRIIQQMIQAVQQEVRDNSFYYLLWGWLVFASSLWQFVCLKTNIELPSWLGWATLMPLGGIATFIYGRKEEKQSRIKTQYDEFLRYVLHAFLISLFIVLFAQSVLLELCYPMVMMVYAIWLYISGGALQFNALRIGGLINWVLAVTCFFFKDIEVQSLILAAAVLFGYIIPGYMLKAKYQSQIKTNS